MDKDCEICGAYSESPNAKTVCIHCYRNLESELRKLRKKVNAYVIHQENARGKDGNN